MNQRQLWTAQIDILEVQRQKYIQRLKEYEKNFHGGIGKGGRIIELSDIIEELDEEIYDLEQAILCLNEDI